MKVFNEAGEEIEVATPEEIKELQAKAEEANTLLNEMKAEIGLEEGKDIKAALKDLKESSNPNWKAAREKLGRYEAALKASGKQIDAQGNIIEPAQAVKPEDVYAAAKKAAREEIIDGRKTALLNRYDAETRKVVEFYYNKLSAGEELTLEKVEKFVSDAEKMAIPEPQRASLPHISGRPPREAPNRENYADTPQGQAIGAMMGLSAFNQPKQ